MDPTVSPLYLDEIDPSVLQRTIRAFRKNCVKFPGDDRDAAVLWAPFLARFQPVLRHYLPDFVGECLALAYDDPEFSKRSQQIGFGGRMRAGDHPHDRDSSLGSYRDDGSYLALQCYDYLQELTR